MDASSALLAVLSVVSLALSSYVLLVCYRNYKDYLRKDRWRRDKSAVDTEWLISETDRDPLIPGEFSRRVIQPILPQIEEDEELVSSKESGDIANCTEYSEDAIGRIIFILQYNTAREELMVRLVQVEGLPGSDNIYNAESAYVDVELKYIGNESSDSEEPSTPPHLDICLQQVYYFVINPDQMFSHVLIFRVNTFDESFRRSVTAEVEVSPILEMGRSVFSGKELVLRKNIYSKIKSDRASTISHELQQPDDAVSTVSSNMSWDIDPSQTKMHSSTFSSVYQSAGDSIGQDDNDTVPPLASTRREDWIAFGASSLSARDRKKSLFSSESQLDRASYQQPSSYYHITPCTSMVFLSDTPPFEDAVSTCSGTPLEDHPHDIDVELFGQQLHNKLSMVSKVKRSLSLPNLRAGSPE